MITAVLDSLARAEIDPITISELGVRGVDAWTSLFRDLVVQALLASAIALLVLAFLFPSFALTYLKRGLGKKLDVYQTWLSVIVTGAGGGPEDHRHHYALLRNIVLKSHLLFL